MSTIVAKTSSLKTKCGHRYVFFKKQIECKWVGNVPHWHIFTAKSKICMQYFILNHKPQLPFCFCDMQFCLCLNTAMCFLFFLNSLISLYSTMNCLFVVWHKLTYCSFDFWIPLCCSHEINTVQIMFQFRPTFQKLIFSCTGSFCLVNYC